MLRNPVVVDIVRAGCIRCRGVQMKGQEHADRWARRIRCVRLLECHTLVRKSADASVAAEIVIKGTVFLDEDDDMFDIAQLCARRRTRVSYSAASAAAA